MADDTGSDKRRRRIELASGRVVEVFKPRPAATAGPARGADTGRSRRSAKRASRAPQREPYQCPACDSTLVYPTGWESVASGRWAAELRCPNCERTETVELEQAAAERFDEELERGAERLIQDLARLSEANMVDHVERFVAALEADAIQPSDF